jgi:hypothetical protein
MPRVNQILEGDSDPNPGYVHWTVVKTHGTIMWRCTHCTREFIVKGFHYCADGKRDAQGHLVP